MPQRVFVKNYQLSGCLTTVLHVFTTKFLAVAGLSWQPAFPQKSHVRCLWGTFLVYLRVFQQEQAPCSL